MLCRSHAAPPSRIPVLAGFEQTVGGVVAKEELVVPVGFVGKFRAPGEGGLLALGQCSFDVAGVGGDGFASDRSGWTFD